MFACRVRDCGGTFRLGDMPEGQPWVCPRCGRQQHEQRHTGSGPYVIETHGPAYRFRDGAWRPTIALD